MSPTRPPSSSTANGCAARAWPRSSSWSSTGSDCGRGPSGEDATDLLLMLTSSGTYLTLQRYGWSEEKYIGWLTDALARQLLAQPGRRGTER